MIVPRESKIKVQILGTKDIGILEGSQYDFFHNLWYFVRVKKILLPYKLEQIKCITPKKLKQNGY